MDRGHATPCYPLCSSAPPDEGSTNLAVLSALPEGRWRQRCSRRAAPRAGVRVGVRYGVRHVVHRAAHQLAVRVWCRHGPGCGGWNCFFFSLTLWRKKGGKRASHEDAPWLCALAFHYRCHSRHTGAQQAVVAVANRQSVRHERKRWKAWDTPLHTSRQRVPGACQRPVSGQPPKAHAQLEPVDSWRRRRRPCTAGREGVPLYTHHIFVQAPRNHE